jgi:drug/metabolite transporter (DMT)-like permease
LAGGDFRFTMGRSGSIMFNYFQPLLPLFLLIAAWGAFRVRRPSGRKWIVASLTGIFLICCRPTEWLFSRVLESAY